MNLHRTTLAALACLALVAAAGERGGAQDAPQADSSGKYVYADFESEKDGRPLSSRGGLVQIIHYQEHDSSPARFKGLANSNPPAPELVRLKPDDPNHAVAFDFELPPPNGYAGVGVEVQGEAWKDGKPVAVDLSGYKEVSLQVFAKGQNFNTMRLEITARGQGLGDPNSYPQATFKVQPGFNTYKIPLKSLTQPQWAQPRVAVKDVLKKSTAVSVTAFCEGGCKMTSGTVVIDNIVFQN
jgi:hypothetical protein